MSAYGPEQTCANAPMQRSNHGVLNNWYVFEFWRGVFVQQEVAKLGQTAIDFPPMQKGASFNLEAVKAQVEKAIARHGK
jgi:arylsulfatase